MLGSGGRIGKYEIRRELGRGAMGSVYEGYDPLLQRRVALRTIRAGLLSGENAETAIARFRREVNAAGRLNHPNIVPIYDFGEDEGVWYIAMEFIEGRELKDYFRAAERFPTSEVVRIMSKVLDALSYSHQLGIIHRDITPANVFLLKDGGVKIADFSIAPIESSNATQMSLVVVTPSYISPEQMMGLPIDARSDLYCAGAMLYQLLTGDRPFPTLQKALGEDPLPPSRFNVQIPGAMDAVVRRALAKRPEDRYQTAAAFADALRDALGHLPQPSALEDHAQWPLSAAPYSLDEPARQKAHIQSGESDALRRRIDKFFGLDKKPWYSRVAESSRRHFKSLVARTYLKIIEL